MPSCFSEFCAEWKGKHLCYFISFYTHVRLVYSHYMTLSSTHLSLKAKISPNGDFQKVTVSGGVITVMPHTNLVLYGARRVFVGELCGSVNDMNLSRYPHTISGQAYLRYFGYLAITWLHSFLCIKGRPGPSRLCFGHRWPLIMKIIVCLRIKQEAYRVCERMW